MRSRIAFIGSLILCASFAGAAVIDQEYDPGAPPYSAALGAGSGSPVRGQSFTAGQSAALSRVEVFVMHPDVLTATDDLIVSVRAGTSPSNPVLDSGIIPYAMVPSGDASAGGENSNAAFVGVDLSGTALLSAGSEYSIWLSTTGSQEYGWWGNSGDPYAGGSAYNNAIPFAGVDLGFRTFVPEPSLGVLPGCVVLVLAARSTRRPR